MKTTPDKLHSLFDRVVAILEEDRSKVVRSVNTSMVLAYWLIGREIVQELQGSEERAEYGKRILGKLSARPTMRYGSGYSLTSLKYFRTFYQVYQDRFPEIGRPSAGELMPLHTRPATGFSPQLSWSHYRALIRFSFRDLPQ